ncbi:carboxypeptidase inhibitor SmCI-like [Dermacentor silvarum]|uniref:carboxypeptidase inhibitor SmCI-like n=1 Tax=Dermacentor silvarum TaxID=543639 RepID=UPI002100DE91|nr:carboxypeptidase inhibitor SmCI-like [Dermacentor silvarum]
MRSLIYFSRKKGTHKPAMKLLAFTVNVWLAGILSTTVFRKVEAHDGCFLQPKVGKCKAAFQRWFYNISARQCQQFIYGGCDGNSNNFRDKMECERLCGGAIASRKPKVNGDCFLRKEVGKCKASKPRWFFDVRTYRCEEFIYGGCGGNKNNFLTQNECEKSCSEFLWNPCVKPIIPASKKSCHGEKKEWRFGYNKETQKCERFLASTCNENINNFLTRRSCLLTCARKSPCLYNTEYHTRRTYVSYLYDAQKDTCAKTTTYFYKYKVWPKDNRFRSIQECEKQCRPKHTTHTSLHKL